MYVANIKLKVYPNLVVMAQLVYKTTLLSWQPEAAGVLQTIGCRGFQFWYIVYTILLVYCGCALWVLGSKATCVSLQQPKFSKFGWTFVLTNQATLHHNVYPQESNVEAILAMAHS